MVQALGARLLDDGGEELGSAAVCWPRSPPSIWTRCGRRWDRRRSSWRPTWTTRCWVPTAPPRSSDRRRAPRIWTWRSWNAASRTGPRSSPRPPVRTSPTVPGAGSAGGAGFGAVALLGAEIRPGIELILEMIDFDQRLAGADLVITGEGSLDEQSLAGKAPIGVSRAAQKAGVRVVAVAGRSLLSSERLRRSRHLGRLSAVRARARRRAEHRQRGSPAATGGLAHRERMARVTSADPADTADAPFDLVLAGPVLTTDGVAPRLVGGTRRTRSARSSRCPTTPSADSPPGPQRSSGWPTTRS